MKSDGASGEKRREATEKKGLDYWMMEEFWGGGWKRQTNRVLGRTWEESGVEPACLPGFRGNLTLQRRRLWQLYRLGPLVRLTLTPRGGGRAVLRVSQQVPDLLHCKPGRILQRTEYPLLWFPGWFVGSPNSRAQPRLWLVVRYLGGGERSHMVRLLSLV